MPNLSTLLILYGKCLDSTRLSSMYFVLASWPRGVDILTEGVALVQSLLLATITSNASTRRCNLAAFAARTYLPPFGTTRSKYPKSGSLKPDVALFPLHATPSYTSSEWSEWSIPSPSSADSDIEVDNSEHRRHRHLTPLILPYLNSTSITMLRTPARTLATAARASSSKRCVRGLSVARVAKPQQQL